MILSSGFLKKCGNTRHLSTDYWICEFSETWDTKQTFLFWDVMDDQLHIQGALIQNFRIPLQGRRLGSCHVYITSIRHFHQAIQTFMIKCQFFEIKLACWAIQQRLIYIPRQLIRFSNDSQPTRRSFWKSTVYIFFQGCTLKFVDNQCDNHLNLTCLMSLPCRKLHVIFFI